MSQLPPAPPTRPSSRPGRPSAADATRDVRETLLRVATQRFAEDGYERVSVRAIAAEAGVNPAMISYYFGGKAGLLDAILDSLVGRILAALTDRPDSGEPLAAHFVRTYLGLISGDPWIPKLIVRVVLTGRESERSRFVDHYASRVAAVVPGLFEGEIAAGRLRADLDPRLTILSLLGMCVFPFIAQPVLGDVLGYELDAEFGRRLTDHTLRLFLDGAAGAAKATEART